MQEFIRSPGESLNWKADSSCSINSYNVTQKDAKECVAPSSGDIQLNNILSIVLSWDTDCVIMPVNVRRIIGGRIQQIRLESEDG